MNDVLDTLQSESKQRPQKLSYIVLVKGDAAEKVWLMLNMQATSHCITLQLWHTTLAGVLT